MKASHIRVLGLSTALVVCAACGQIRPRAQIPPKPDQVSIPKEDANKMAFIVKGIPQNASKTQMDEAMKLLLPEVHRARTEDLPQVLAALNELRNQPNVVSALVNHYEGLPTKENAQRLIAVELVGELQRSDAMPFFREVIWKPLPEKEPLVEGLTPRELEEMILVKAVHGLAYLRIEKAYEALIQVMLRHESKLAQVAAIDSYMWNHGDSSVAAQHLYETLPKPLHRFVERPRFYQGMDPEDFTKRLKVWQERWRAPAQ